MALSFLAAKEKRVWLAQLVTEHLLPRKSEVLLTLGGCKALCKPEFGKAPPRGTWRVTSKMMIFKYLVVAFRRCQGHAVKATQ